MFDAGREVAVVVGDEDAHRRSIDALTGLSAHLYNARSMPTCNARRGRMTRQSTLAHRACAAGARAAGACCRSRRSSAAASRSTPGDTWSHLASTVLPRYVGNTLALVRAGRRRRRHRRHGRGMARRAPPLSRAAAFFAWALLLPLAMPSYVMAYAYTDFLQYAGPLQTALREAFGWSRDDYWFPDVRSLPGAAAMFVFTLYPYVFLLARTAFVERPPALLEAARTLGLDRRAHVLARRAAARAPGDRRRHRARADGDARRLRHRRVLRRRHVHDRHLSRVVLARRPRRGGAARRGAAAVRGRRRRARARVARRRAHATTARAASAPAPAAPPRADRRRARCRDDGVRDSARSSASSCRCCCCCGCSSAEADVALTARYFVVELGTACASPRSRRCSRWCSPTLMAYARAPRAGHAHARGQPRAHPGVRGAGHGARGRRAAAARRARQRARRRGGAR